MLNKIFLINCCVSLVLGDVTDRFLTEYVSNPVARHVGFPIQANTAGIATLAGHENDGHDLEYYVTSLPSVGKLSFIVRASSGDFDYLNIPPANATECEIAATLNGLTKLKILGDFTKSSEGVELDEVKITASLDQPAFPVTCQQGCTCRHFDKIKRINCCGNYVA